MELFTNCHFVGHPVYDMRQSNKHNDNGIESLSQTQIFSHPYVFET